MEIRTTDPLAVKIARALATLADTGVPDFDQAAFAGLLVGQCVELVGVDAAGLLLADQGGILDVIAASSEPARTVELSGLRGHEGAGIECYRSAGRVQSADLGRERARWPRFAGAARAAGFASVSSLPMRSRERVIGAMSMFGASAGALDDNRLVLGQALADVATIGLLNHRTLRRHETLVEQLQGALESRVLIEQAKGILAVRRQLGVEEAFAVLRAHARGHNRRLTDVARAVVDSTGDADDPLDGS
ncbi:GAF and ANTAR domain-containing protein [Pseudonocardia acaciae]|uniref:GAF and ANTAR domain-containing protein n=1 Tax=Pseudonocardia acaciae TaxID=551276 RepID=UPI000686F09F|nr:GAF and ANTAR domain-containing protein [Pseudonocardia acaciae]